MLILAHVTGAALGEEMDGPSPYPAAALPSVPVQPGFGLLQVGGRSQSRTIPRLTVLLIVPGNSIPRCHVPFARICLRSERRRSNPFQYAGEGCWECRGSAPGSTFVVRTAE